VLGSDEPGPLLLSVPLNSGSQVTPGISFRGWGFGARTAHVVGLHGPEGQRLGEASLISESDNYLRLNFAEMPALMQTLSDGDGGLHYFRVKAASGPGIAVLVLSRMEILEASSGVQAGTLAAQSSSYRQFAEITAANAPTRGGVDYWCEFRAEGSRHLLPARAPPPLRSQARVT